jgi:hypothetical protein
MLCREELPSRTELQPSSEYTSFPPLAEDPSCFARILAYLKTYFGKE